LRRCENEGKSRRSAAREPQRTVDAARGSALAHVDLVVLQRSDRNALMAVANDVGYAESLVQVLAMQSHRRSRVLLFELSLQCELQIDTSGNGERATGRHQGIDRGTREVPLEQRARRVFLARSEEFEGHVSPSSD